MKPRQSREIGESVRGVFLGQRYLVPSTFISRNSGRKKPSGERLPKHAGAWRKPKELDTCRATERFVARAADCSGLVKVLNDVADAFKNANGLHRLMDEMLLKSLLGKQPP